MKTSFPLTLVLLCVPGQRSTVSAASAGDSRPNVLFILVDDHGIKDVGIDGSTFYETPNIDRIARSGTRFTQGYAACQVCSPSRAAIMLRKSPARIGITDYIGAAVGEAFAKRRHVKLLVPDYVRNLPAADTTLAEALRQAVSFPKTSSEGNEGSLIDGYWENTVCSRRRLQQEKQPAESQSGAVEAGTFRSKRQHKIHCQYT